MSQILPALYGASVLLANSTLWILGGNTDIQPNATYSIDVSKPWNISSPPLTTIPTSGQAPTSRYFSSLALDANGSSLWLYGGASKTLDLTEASQFAVFNTRLGAWSSNSSLVSGQKPPAAFAGSAVRDSKGVVYYYGGSADLTDLDLSDFWDGPGLAKLDTRTANFSLVPVSPGNPGSVGWHTATLVNDTLMYVIGGLSQNPSDDFPVAVYNTVTNTWSHPVNSTQNPPTRHGHTAALSDDNSQIIVYGGVSGTNNYFNDVWTLNLATNQWTQRNTTGNAPTARAFHNSVVIKSQMIVLFGFPQKSPNTPYVLDIKSWTWLTSFNPGYIPSPVAPTTASSVVSVANTPSSTDTSMIDTPVFSNTPISAAGIAGIVLAAIAVVSIVMVSIVQPRNRVKPLM